MTAKVYEPVVDAEGRVIEWEDGTLRYAAADIAALLTDGTRERVEVGEDVYKLLNWDSGAVEYIINVGDWRPRRAVLTAAGVTTAVRPWAAPRPWQHAD